MPTVPEPWNLSSIHHLAVFDSGVAPQALVSEYDVEAVVLRYAWLDMVLLKLLESLRSVLYS